jgi:hypothetical protein
MKAGGRFLVMLVSATLGFGACATEARKEVAETADQAPQGAVQGTPATAQPEFVATEELYRRTFREVQDVISELTRIITEADYDQWLTHLTEGYVKTTGSPAFLADVSRSGVLKKSGIVLHTLKDYFENVVVRSRLQATLDDITFVDEDHVKAITIIQGSEVILYYLVREEGSWKVGIMEHAQDTEDRGREK